MDRHGTGGAATLLRQSQKAVTDVGSGAGSMSRASDTHLVLRLHEEPGCVVLDAAVRSWPPIEPRVLRWTFPVWTPDDTLDPARLRSERAHRRVSAQAREQSDEPDWTPERFAEAFVAVEPHVRADIVQSASAERLSARRAVDLLRQAEDAGLVHRWKYASNKPVAFSIVPQVA